MVALLLALGGYLTSLFLITAALLLAMLGALVYLWSRFALSGIEARRTVTPERIETGGIARVEIEIVNAKALPLPWLRVDAPLPSALRWVAGQGDSIDAPISYLVRLAPNERSTATFDIRPLERGVHRLGPLSLRTADPLGFKISRSRKRSTDRIVVSPPRFPLERFGLDPSLRWLDDESNGAREPEPEIKDQRVPWDPADSPPHAIAGKSSTDRYRSIVLVVDVTGDSMIGNEWTLSAAASIAVAALSSGDAVSLETGVCAMGSRRRICVRPDRGQKQIDRILEALAAMPLRQRTSLQRLMRWAVRRADSKSIIWIISSRDRIGAIDSERSILTANPDGLSESSSSGRGLDAEAERRGWPISVPVHGRLHRINRVLVSPPDDRFRASNLVQNSAPFVSIDVSESPSTRSARTPTPVAEGWIGLVCLPIARLLLRLSWVWPWTVLTSQIAIPGARPGVTLGALVVLTWIGHALGRAPVGRLGRSWFVPILIVGASVVAVLGTTWLLTYRSILPIWELAWIRDLGLETLQGGPTTIRRVIAILAATFVCVSAVVDAEEPADHASIWSGFASAIALLITHASIVEIAGDQRVEASTSWLLFAFSVGVVALVASGIRLGQRIEPKARRPWQPG